MRHNSYPSTHGHCEPSMHSAAHRPSLQEAPPPPHAAWPQLQHCWRMNTESLATVKFSVSLPLEFYHPTLSFCLKMLHDSSVEVEMRCFFEEAPISVCSCSRSASKVSRGKSFLHLRQSRNADSQYWTSTHSRVVLGPHLREAQKQ